MVLVSIVEKESTLRAFLKQKMRLSSNLILMLSRDKMIFVDGRSRFLNFGLEPGMKVIVNVSYEQNTYEPSKARIDVVFEDDQILIVNKEPGVTVHPTAKTPNDTLLNHISYYQQLMKEDYKIHIVNRLDRDTSGLVIVAKTKFMHHQLSEEFKGHRVMKEYIAIVHGRTPGCFQDESPIVITDGIKHFIGEDGKESYTDFQTIESGKNWSLVRCFPITGRTHQIRLHLAHQGFPIIGDQIYGIKDMANRQMLHCSSIAFKDPRTDRVCTHEASWKQDFIDMIEKLKEQL